MKKILACWYEYCSWRTANKKKATKDMPSSYLLVQFSGATFITTMLPTILIPATKSYFDALHQGMPWWWGAVVLWLSTFWGAQFMALVTALLHGRALVEKLSQPPPQLAPIRCSRRREQRRR